MANIALRVDGLGKRYRVGHRTADPHYTALRDVIARHAAALVRTSRALLRGEAIVDGDVVEEFWALQDVTFEIPRGERVGIIGRNGAGKSTLLKVLSGITEPTRGRVEVHGRVASLLEVGTGFHPELTGRENVFLSGAILGMTHREIQAKFDAIVDFAEVERFLDTPVKHFSSGMYTRLAFAVAAHLEPEILVVDEVLAVGDLRFQRKCLGKMDEVGRNEGRTVLFVSHQMAAITRLCTHTIWMDQGRVVESGVTADIVGRYQQGTEAQATFTGALALVRRHGGEGRLRFTRVRTFAGTRESFGDLVTGEECAIRADFVATVVGARFNPTRGRISLAFESDAGVTVILSSEMLPKLPVDGTGAPGSVTFQLPRNPLTPGHYSIKLFLESDGVIEDWITEGIVVQVSPGDYYGSGRLCPAGFEGRAVLVDFDMRLGGEGC
jgi:lipopolysaccharide transport system ATP-binding protein